MMKKLLTTIAMALIAVVAIAQGEYYSYNLIKVVPSKYDYKVDEELLEPGEKFDPYYNTNHRTLFYNVIKTNTDLEGVFKDYVFCARTGKSADKMVNYMKKIFKEEDVLKFGHPKFIARRKGQYSFVYNGIELKPTFGYFMYYIIMEKIMSAMNFELKCFYDERYPNLRFSFYPGETDIRQTTDADGNVTVEGTFYLFNKDKNPTCIDAVKKFEEAMTEQVLQPYRMANKRIKVTDGI